MHHQFRRLTINRKEEKNMKFVEKGESGIFIKQHPPSRRFAQILGCEATYRFLIVCSSEPCALVDANRRFRGCGDCTNVHSWLWNWQRTHISAPSFMTHLLLRLRHASHGLSLRPRVTPFSPLALEPPVDLPAPLVFIGGF